MNLPNLFSFFRKKPKTVTYNDIEYPVYILEKIDFDILKRINDLRKSKGLIPLKMNPKLCNIAASHSAYMARNKVCNYDGLNLRALNYHGFLYEESVLCGFYTGYSLVGLLLESDADRANILNKEFLYIGISTAEDRNGKVYAALNFSDKKE